MVVWKRFSDCFVNFWADSIPSNTGRYHGRPSKFMHISEPIPIEKDDFAKFDKHAS
jgi:hypothetical protein